MHAKTNSIHIPVLLGAVLEYLQPNDGATYLDLTAGYGGHASAVLAHTQNAAGMVLVDRDAAAIEALQELADKGARLIRNDFLEASKELLNREERFDMILADLGVSSLHLDKPERGFTFREEGPLDMRMDQRGSLTAADIVNTYDEAALVELLRTYGEEPQAKRIAGAMLAHRPLHDTAALAAAVESVVPRRGRIHPATKTFQALRIAVNDELGLLEKAIPLWLQLLAPGGRLGVISFHSLEDRLVKQEFAEVTTGGYDVSYQSLTKKPVVADDAEIVSNPRSRSAKLRVVAKINKYQSGSP